MQAGITQTHFLIKAMDWKRRKYIVDTIARTTNFFHRRKQYRFVIEVAYNKFFYTHKKTSSKMLYVLRYTFCVVRNTFFVLLFLNVVTYNVNRLT